MATINLVGRKFEMTQFDPRKGYVTSPVKVVGQADGETEDIVEVKWEDHLTFGEGYIQSISISNFIKDASYEIIL